MYYETTLSEGNSLIRLRIMCLALQFKLVSICLAFIMRSPELSKSFSKCTHQTSVYTLANNTSVLIKIYDLKTSLIQLISTIICYFQQLKLLSFEPVNLNECSIFKWKQLLLKTKSSSSIVVRPLGMGKLIYNVLAWKVFY